MKLEALRSALLRDLRPLLVLSGVGLFLSCGEQVVPSGVQLDQSLPSVVIQKTAGDTVSVETGLQFSVEAKDNLGLKTISVSLTGGVNELIDTTFNTAVTDFILDVLVEFEQNTIAGGDVIIQATVTDGNNNPASDSTSIFLSNAQALIVTVLQPTAGAPAAPGLSIPVEIVASQETGIRKVGYLVSGVVTGGDSTPTQAPPLQDTLSFNDTLAVPATAQLGDFTVTGFAEDSIGRRAQSSPVSVTVQQVIVDTTAPAIELIVASRVEKTDSLTIVASDGGGGAIASIGWFATEPDGTPIAATGSTEVFAPATLTNVRQVFPLDFTFTSAQLHKDVVINAFAIDNSNNRADTTQATLVVHGRTHALPLAGSLIADAIYNRNRNEVYLTNIDLDRIEVFDVATESFAAAIPVGSRPWGIALWPADTFPGNNLDSVVVANSGGTNISIVDVRGTVRAEVRRHSLPNFIVQTVNTVIDPNTGTLEIVFEDFDFSDRPAFIGTTCRPNALLAPICAADSIYVVYSTSPSIDQQTLPLRSTMRWENLTAGTPQSHFFWEHASVLAGGAAVDSIRIFADRGPAQPFDTVLSIAHGITVDLEDLVFFDTTFVRNSGNFTHAFIGEGGVGPPDKLARVVGYNGNRLLQRVVETVLIGPDSIPVTGPTEEDFGITNAFRVRDFVSNTSIPVRSIGINFNGFSNIVRADSVYVLNESLRLVGTIEVGGANAGMDMNFDHDFVADNAVSPTGKPITDRVVFLATEGPRVEVYDTFFYDKLASVEIRDPVIGPLRVARLASGEQLLVGVTQAGVVLVTLPAISNPPPTPPASSGFAR